jgi:hypothetical protein
MVSPAVGAVATVTATVVPDAAVPVPIR